MKRRGPPRARDSTFRETARWIACYFLAYHQYPSMRQLAVGIDRVQGAATYQVGQLVERGTLERIANTKKYAIYRISREGWAELAEDRVLSAAARRLARTMVSDFFPASSVLELPNGGRQTELFG